VNHEKLRRTLGIVWLAGVSVAIYLALFRRDVIEQRLAVATATSMAAGGGLYLVLGCLRGFTMIPATSLVIMGMVFFPPVPLFLLTLAGIIVSSTSVYYFAEALHLEEVLTKRHAHQMDRLRALLDRHGLPIIIGWSFFPLAPTDLICYLAGVLRVSVVTCLAGVAIGEGAICAVYIFLGHWLLQRL
jgi:uncharacterized membrane protein YdjX (TVP38/TMEM64 family)